MPTASVFVDPVSCFDTGEVGVTVGVTASGTVMVERQYLYDRNGDLIAVQDRVTDEYLLAFGGCVGGPATLAKDLCTDFLLGFVCYADAGLPDGSAE